MTKVDALRWGGLALLVFFSGVVDALAGGGGLITLPAYLAAGLPPGLLLGTNKLASTIGSTASMALYARSLRLRLREVLPAAAAAVAGALLGARAALSLDPSYIRWLLLVALPPTAWSVLARRRFHDDDSGASAPARLLLRRTTAVAFPLGIYDGFFGPGTGTFLALGLRRVCRFSLLRATAWTKVINWVSNAAALSAFLAAGAARLPLGLAMGAAAAAGHFTGSRIGLRRGSRAIRPALAGVCAALFLKILLDAARGY